MRQSVRAIVFNADEDYSATLRRELLSIEGMHIVAEVDEPALIDQAITQFPAEVLIAHLDPIPDAVLPVITQITQNNPQLAVFVVSENTDGQYILQAMRAGIREFLTKPVDRQLLTEALEKLTSNHNSPIEMGRLIAILGTIGGAGASSLAVNLATELASIAGEDRVALVDLDFRYGQLGTMLDLQPSYTIADLCDTPEQLDESMINKAMVRHDSGVHLLARPNSFGHADQITAAHCASVLSTLQQMYDYVVVDGPMRFDSGGLSVLDMADMNILLIQLLVTSVRNVHRMIEELRDSGYNLERFKLICNRVGRESAHLEVAHVEQTVNVKVAHQIPDDWKSVGSSINMGTPLAETAPKSRVRASIRELADKISNPELEAEKNGDKHTFFSRIFSGAV
jgi:pilus assembly protein CpaE